MSSPLRTAVLISGSGTNLQALIDACEESLFPAEIVLVLSNNADAYGLERARKAGIATAVVDHRNYPDRESFDADIDIELKSAGVQFVCLAGFMRVLTDGFVRKWHDRMINVHPSLLPLYRGLHTHKRAIEAGDNWHGCSVHFVRPDLDTGPNIIQARVPIIEGDTPDTLAQRVLTREHIAYPMALQLVAEGRVTIGDETVYIDGHKGPKVLEWQNQF